MNVGHLSEFEKLGHPDVLFKMELAVFTGTSRNSPLKKIILKERSNHTRNFKAETTNRNWSTPYNPNPTPFPSLSQQPTPRCTSLGLIPF